MSSGEDAVSVQGGDAREDPRINETLTVSLHHVSKHYGSLQAVRDVSLEILGGEFLAIIGPSGCGKTTTLRMIAGLEKPSSGDILIGGRRVNDVKPWKRETPLVWQSFALFPHLTVGKNVEFGLRMRRVARTERKERVRRALEFVGMAELVDRSVVQLSGGQKQRVGIARALVLDPRVLLLDEPLGALDAKIGRSMQRELRRLHTELGITFIYVTHNQSEALAMADRIAVMNDGAIQQLGTPQEIYRQPRNRFVADFVGTNNIFRGRVTGIDGEYLQVSTPQCDFSVRRDWRSDIATEQPVEFVVSADRLVIYPEVSTAENTVEGRIAAIEVTGSVMALFVELKGGYELKLQKSEQQIQGVALSIGDVVRLSWPAEAAFILTETSEIE